MRRHGLTCHITHLWTATIFIHSAVVDGDINISAYWIRTVDAATIEISDNSMVYLECNTAINLIISRTVDSAKMTAINVAFGVALICKGGLVWAIKTREIKLWEIAANDINWTKSDGRIVICAHIRVGTRSKTVEPQITTKQKITGSVSIAISHG